jgi:hypothetical protein
LTRRKARPRGRARSGLNEDLLLVTAAPARCGVDVMILLVAAARGRRRRARPRLLVAAAAASGGLNEKLRFVAAAATAATARDGLDAELVLVAAWPPRAVG